MSKNCILCNTATIFFIWGSNGRLNVDKLRGLLFNKNKDIKKDIVSNDVVCMTCCYQHKLL